MMPQTSVSKEAEERLSEVSEAKHFVTKDGSRLKSINDLKEKAKDMSQETFGHHVNDDKNDFHKWVKDVHEDHQLASDIEHVKSAQELHDKVSNRVGFLQRLRDKEVAFLTRHHIRLGAFDFVFGLCVGVVVGLILAQIIL